MSNYTDSTSTHNDYVGGPGSVGRIPGADQATSGSQFEAVFAKDQSGRTMKPGQFHSGETRPDEHIPAPTGRDRPPRHDVRGADFTRGVDQSDNATPVTRVETPIYSSASGPGGYDQPPSDIRQLNEPRVSEVVVDSNPWASRTSASDTLNGATSQDVHGGYGHPGQGQSSAQLHHDGAHSHRKRAEEGLGRYGEGDDSLVHGNVGDQAQ
ncbi:hypothetical protein PUNSTDRAFT_86692 [Punctularia strigosozonata HHB-11173 SS5]|uniref:uncharacterized protein n=1 Tax=Punctularia strigosozonata (strain HHB-11173) TaxID=741275 RepID=UPI0004417254|nr:uncharacterized protein PUNSTDRAFT_86692 [Punctularia strigosozonata HHB-11173 SS5]EIN08696.1 hypothetical protein PUNSTDRAFT_86692 [Punctularia strigosozonata HHB-11173 SS5]